MDRLFLIAGALSGALGVAAGAFGAHALRARVEPRMLEVFETAARYQMYHALALIAVAWVCTRTTSSFAGAAGWLPVGFTASSRFHMCNPPPRWASAWGESPLSISVGRKISPHFGTARWQGAGR